MLAARLDQIPGIGPTAAAVIIAEIGLDMTRFPTPAHLASWAKFAPGINSSAGKTKDVHLDTKPLPRPHPRRSRGLHRPGPTPSSAPATDAWCVDEGRRRPSSRSDAPSMIIEHLAVPRHRLPRPRRRPLRPPPQHRRQTTQPRPPTRSARLPRHSRTRRLTHPAQRGICQVTSIFGLVTHLCVALDVDFHLDQQAKMMREVGRFRRTAVS